VPTRDEMDEHIATAEDLEHLRDEWWNDPPDDVIRRGRRHPQTIPTRGRVAGERGMRSASKRSRRSLRPTSMRYSAQMYRASNWHSLAAQKLKGVFVAGGCVNKGQQPPPDPGAGAATAMEHPFKLSAFRESTSVVAKGQRVRRLELVKYFAHEKCGVHPRDVSPRRKRADEEFVRQLRVLEKAIIVFHKEAFFFELLSIGQSVGRAPDMQKLIAAIRAHPGRDSA